MQLPWRTQLWVGPVEVAIVVAAILLGSGRRPTLVEAVHLCMYGLLLLLLPLLTVKWQEQQGRQPADGRSQHSKQPAEADTDASCHITDKAGQGHSGAVTAPAANHSKAGPSTSGVTSPVKVQLQQVLEDLIARQYAEGLCSQQPPATDSRQTTPQVHGVPGATQAASSLAGAARPRRSFLYTSPLHHDVMSVKVKVPCTVVTHSSSLLLASLASIGNSERPFAPAVCQLSWFSCHRSPPVAQTDAMQQCLSPHGRSIASPAATPPPLLP
jgi:hypothetical protein